MSWTAQKINKKMLNPGGGWGGVEVLGVNILWTADKIDNFSNTPVGGARAKLGNQLVYQ